MKARGLGGVPLGTDSPLFGGSGSRKSEPAADQPTPEDLIPLDGPDREAAASELEHLRSLLSEPDSERSVDDWGRSERIVSLFDPLLDFYYRYWFRVETEGIENIPDEGGALLVGNHSGALPPDAPMVMQAIRNEHPAPQPLYMLGEHWFKGYPGVGMLVNKLGLVPAHRANAQRLLGEEGRLAIVFPEGQKGTRKVYWQRYRLRRFGRGGFVRTAIRAQVPMVPVAIVGGEEAMPIFAHLRLFQKLTGLIYFPVTPSFPWFGLAAALMYTPAKFRIHFLEPVRTDLIPPQLAEDPAEVQAVSEEIRGRIQTHLDGMLRQRNSIWLG